MYSMKIHAKDSWPLYSVYMSHGRGGNFKTLEHSFVHHSSHPLCMTKIALIMMMMHAFPHLTERKGKTNLKMLSKGFFSLQLTLPIINKN